MYLRLRNRNSQIKNQIQTHFKVFQIEEKSMQSNKSNSIQYTIIKLPQLKIVFFWSTLSRLFHSSFLTNQWNLSAIED